MAKAVDYSFARPAIEDLHGYAGVLRYLAPVPNRKVLTVGERDALLAAGFSLGVVWEWYADRAGQGYNPGKADCATAETMADQLEIPSGAAIYYAVDYDADPNAIRPYFQGISEVHGHPVGGYGSFRVVEALFDWGLITYGWQATAWSHGKRSTRAHLFQRVGAPIPGTDENDILQDDWGQWPRVIAPPSKEEDMPSSPAITTASDGVIWRFHLAKNDGKTYYAKRGDGEWFALPGEWSSSPDAAAGANGSVIVIGRVNNGGLWETVVSADGVAAKPYPQGGEAA